MKLAAALLACAGLILAACQSPAQKAARAIAEDDAWCRSVGIGPSDPRYADCRQSAALVRLQKEAADTARAAAISSALSRANPFTNMPPPDPVEMPKSWTCQNVGMGAIRCY